MARILCVVGPHRGLLNASAELCRRLAAAGHEVQWSTPVGTPEVEAISGVARTSWDPRPVDAWRAADVAGSWSRWRRVAQRRGRWLDRLREDRFDPLLEEFDADLVLVDIELHEHVLRAHARRPGSVAVLNPFVSVWRRPGLPPPHVDTVPGRGAGAQPWAVALRWWLWRARKASRAAKLLIRDAACDRRSLLRTLGRRTAGPGPGLRSDSSQWLMPWIYPQIPALALHALEFEFPHRPAAGVHYVGPQVAGPQVAGSRVVDDAETRQVPPRHPAVRLLERRGADECWIYASFGSFLTAHPRWVTTLVETVRRRTDWHLVLGLAGRSETLAGERLDLDALPPNVHRFDWVPQVDVMRRADLAVVHGGSGSSNDALLARTPTLVLCGHQTDMAGVTARTAFHGVGAIADPSDDVETLTGRIERLLDDEEMRRRVKELGDLVDRYRREQVLERVVEELLHGSCPPGRVEEASRYWSTVPRGGWSGVT